MWLQHGESNFRRTCTEVALSRAVSNSTAGTWFTYALLWHIVTHYKDIMPAPHRVSLFFSKLPCELKERLGRALVWCLRIRRHLEDVSHISYECRLVRTHRRLIYSRLLKRTTWPLKTASLSPTSLSWLNLVSTVPVPNVTAKCINGSCRWSSQFCLGRSRVPLRQLGGYPQFDGSDMAKLGYSTTSWTHPESLVPPVSSSTAQAQGVVIRDAHGMICSSSAQRIQESTVLNPVHKAFG